MHTHPITPPDRHLLPQIQEMLDQKTKPPGSLGMLETLAARLCLIQQTLTPHLANPHVVVFAADHGIAESGVSRYPPAVTAQMVLNFAAGGAAINVFCRQHGLGLRVVDAGVKDFTAPAGVLPRRIGNGTANFLHGPAMSGDQCRQARAHGAEVVAHLHAGGCNVVGFGEMGIGNTASAAVLMHKLTGTPLPQCVGRGTGLDQAGWQHKCAVLAQAAARADVPAGTDPLAVLAHFGGFEIAMLCGAFLEAAARRMVILVDGFIATAALLAAHALQPAVLDYCVFCHQSDEAGHARMLEWLHAEPLLRLSMRLGEGSGCAVAYPLLESAVAFATEMATFASANVSRA